VAIHIVWLCFTYRICSVSKTGVGGGGVGVRALQGGREGVMSGLLLCSSSQQGPGLLGRRSGVRDEV
jgi:hypothetical protein